MQTAYHFAGSSTAAYQALKSYDLDPDKVFEEAGLNVKSLSDPEYRSDYAGMGGVLASLHRQDRGSAFSHSDR